MIAHQRRGKILYGLLLAAGLSALGIGQALLQDRAEAQGAEVQAPRFEVDPFWPKPLPNNWLLGSVIGVWADDQDNIWIIHLSSSTLHNNEKGAELTPRSPNAAAARRRCWSSIRPGTSCGPGAVPARATSGRNRTTASMSTIRAMSGSAATARRTRTR